MLARQSVLLHHISRAGRHYDWCFEDPNRCGADARLITFRLALPTHQWGSVRSLGLLRIADHRRTYLHYTGSISRSRGFVQQVDRGKIIVRSWSNHAACLDVRLEHYRGVLQLHRTGLAMWHAGSKHLAMCC